MEIKQTKRSRLISRVLAVAMVVCLLFGMAISANAADVNQAVTDAKNGVVQIQVWFCDPEAALETPLHYGTGFLVNDSTVVTCEHVATGFPDQWYVDWAQITKETLGINRTAAQVKANLELRIMLYRGTYIKASLKNANPELDLAILTLSQSISRTPLAIRGSDSLSQTEEAYAIGFPSDLLELADKQTYDIDDIAITSGNVNKITDMTFTTVEGKNYDSVNCVESSARITGGNSGGPLVDADGKVIGVNAAGDGATRNIAVSSKELITYLTQLSIEFNEAGKPAPEKPETPDKETELNTTTLSGLIDEVEDINAQDYTEESYKALKDALKAAKAALTATAQSDIDAAANELDAALDALEEYEVESALDQYVMIGIIAAVVVIIAIVAIVLVVVLGKKKKPATPAAPAPAAAPAAPVAVAKPAAAPAAPAPKPAAVPVSSETTVLKQGAGETTVLSHGAGETTVLSQNVNGGTLVRTGNNERITISSAEFTVGRERSNVDYCVGGNTNISRVHARFVVRDGVTYIVDNKAANGTFVNGVKARAGQEIELKNGDKILLADEAFEFNK